MFLKTFTEKKIIKNFNNNKIMFPFQYIQFFATKTKTIKVFPNKKQSLKNFNEHQGQSSQKKKIKKKYNKPLQLKKKLKKNYQKVFFNKIEKRKIMRACLPNLKSLNLAWQ
jgi:hypothetical protein